MDSRTSVVTMGLKMPEDLPQPIERLSAEGLERKRQMAQVASSGLVFLTSEFVKRGFEWLLPVTFSKSTDPLWPDPGASIEKRIEVDIYGARVQATLSMIIHKMVACSLAYPKLFLLSPNLRIERRDRAATGRHVYEFTQLDFEVRNASAEAIRALVEDVLVGLVTTMRRHRKGALSALGRLSSLRTPNPPFPVFDRSDLIREHREAWEARVTEEARDPVWVTNVPREFYDYEDDGQGRWDNYDLILPGYGEVLSGARREWTYAKMRSKMERDGVDPGRYELILDLARSERLQPSAGAGIGLERLFGWIVGAAHIGEVQPFPRIPGTVHDL